MSVEVTKLPSGLTVERSCSPVLVCAMCRLPFSRGERVGPCLEEAPEGYQTMAVTTGESFSGGDRVGVLRRA